VVVPNGGRDREPLALVLVEDIGDDLGVAVDPEDELGESASGHPAMTDLPFLRDLVVLLLLSLGIVLIFQRLRQPSIVGFLAAGVALGPHGLSVVLRRRHPA